MLFELLGRHAAEFPAGTFLHDADATYDYARALARVRAFAGVLGRTAPDRFYVHGHDGAAVVFALLAADLLGREACVLDRRLAPPEVAATIAELGPGLLLSDAGDEPGDDQPVGGAWTALGSLADAPAPDGGGPAPATPAGRVLVLTSGTTGKPKAVPHTWSRLVAQGRRTDAHAQQEVWLLAYPLNHFAGLQVLLHVLINGLTLVIPRSRGFDDVLAAVLARRVTAISATPTFWRLFLGRLTAEQRRRVPLRRATLGGEAATAEVLERLGTSFPRAAVRQVYATTELGSCFAVDDGRPGFPAAYLARPVGNVELRVRSGELQVRPRRALAGPPAGAPPPAPGDGWVATGDLVEVAGARVLFRGRRSEVINVGGVKVHPLKVEAAILSVAGVGAARAYGVPNPVTGQVVVADLEIGEGFGTHEEVADRVRQACARSLTRYERPRALRIVAEVPRRNEKVVRRSHG